MKHHLYPSTLNSLFKVPARAGVQSLIGGRNILMKFLLVLVVFGGMWQSLPAQLDLQVVWEKPAGERINAAKFSKDGNFIYCSIGNTIQKMDAKTGEFNSKFYNEDSLSLYWFENMEISNSGNFLLSTNGNGSALVWDTRTEKRVKKIDAGEYVTCAAMSVDEQTLLIGRFGGGFIIFDLINNKLDSTHRSKINVSQIVFSHNGKYFVTGSWYEDNITKKDYNQLILWETETFKQVATLQDIEITTGVYGYRIIKFSPDDKYLGDIRLDFDGPDIFDLNTKKLVRTTDGRACKNLDFLPDSLHFLAAFGLDGTEKYEIANNSLTKSYKNILSSIIESCKNQNGESVIFIYGDTNRLLKMIATEIKELANNNDKIHVFIENGKVVITINNNMLVSTINVSINNLQGKTVFTENISSIFNDNKIILDVDLPSGIYICNVNAGTEKYSQKFEIVR